MKIVMLEGLGVSQDIINFHIRRLKSMGHELVCYQKDADADVQVSRSEGADAIILANMPLSERVVESVPTLRFIDVAFTGVDHIPMGLARSKGIAVSNASGYATQAVAETTIGFMIQLLRHVDEVQDRCRSGGTKDGLVGNLLSGKVIGIIGAGAIGKRVAMLCKAFGCRVIAFSRSPVSDPNIDSQVTLEELLRASDIVSLHCPLTDETRGMIGAEQIGMMKDSALLVNTARGAVIDSSALASALRDGRLAGAACDVFEMEPPIPADHPLLDCPHTILTPHIAFASKESMELRAEIVFDNLYSWIDGRQKNVM